MAFGRLERTRGPEPMSDINVTPLVDVMLVLVVIFIVTAPLLASAIRLDLPKAASAQPVTEAVQALTVAVDARGELFLNDAPVTLNQLFQRFSDAAHAAPDTEIHLRADHTVPYGRVVQVMDAAGKAGLNRIGFVAEQPKN